LRTAGYSFKKVSEGLKGTMTNLSGVIQDITQRRARCKIQPEQLADEMSVEKVILSTKQLNDSALRFLMSQFEEWSNFA